MKIDLTKTVKTSKLQPKIFQVFREMQQTKDNYLLVVDSNNNPLGAIVSPLILEKYLENKEKTNLDQELDNFNFISEQSFDFWNNSEDDIYEKFYK